MKNFPILILILTLTTLTLHAEKRRSSRRNSESIRVGGTLQPKTAWMSPTYLKAERNGTKLSLDFTACADYPINKHMRYYGGVMLNGMSSSLNFSDSIGYIGAADYTLSYLSFQLGIKLYSERIGRKKLLQFYGNFGIIPELNIEKQVSLSQESIGGYDDIKPFMLSYYLEGGAEYKLDQKISAIAALNYATSFTNMLGIEGNTYLSSFGLKLGLMFTLQN